MHEHDDGCRRPGLTSASGNSTVRRGRPVPWVVTFDVASDAGRRAINNLLGEYGPRVLFTVYEIGADPVELDGIMWRAERHLRPGDHLLALPACGRCRTAFRGGQVETVAPTGWVVS